KNNDKIFGLPFGINSRNTFDKFKTRKIIIKENLNDVFNGFCQLSSVTSNEIYFFCFADISILKNLLGTKKLSHLDLTDINHVFDETIFDTWDDLYPIDTPNDYRYPIIDYGNLRKRVINNDPESPDLLLLDMYPALKLRRAV